MNMPHRQWLLWFSVFSIVDLGRSLLVAQHPAPAPQPSSALTEYVARADDSFAWTVRRSGMFGSGNFAELTLTSQTWHGTLWKHQLFVYRPSHVACEKQVLLLIDGGS